MAGAAGVRFGSGKPNIDKIIGILRGWDSAADAFLRSQVGKIVRGPFTSCLNIAERCEYRKAGAALRSTIANHPRADLVRNDVLTALVFAMEYAAQFDSKDIEGFFSAREKSFDFSTGFMRLLYEDGAPHAWELVGDRSNPNGTFVIAGGKTVVFTPRFLKPDRRDRRIVEARLQGKLIRMNPGDEFVFACAGRMGDASVLEGKMLVLRDGDIGRAATTVGYRGEPSATSPHYRRLARDFFSHRRTIIAILTKKCVEFTVDTYYRSSLNLSGPDRFTFSVTGEGESICFDWIAVSGTIDGSWLARALVIQDVGATRNFFDKWKAP